MYFAMYFEVIPFDIPWVALGAGAACAIATAIVIAWFIIRKHLSPGGRARPRD
jgi:hypothetical protein